MQKKIVTIILCFVFISCAVTNRNELISIKGKLIDVKWQPTVRGVKTATLTFEPIKKDSCLFQFRYKDNSRTGYPKFRLGAIYKLCYDPATVRKGDSVIRAFIRKA